jgi:hypothetical protein
MSNVDGGDDKNVDDRIYIYIQYACLLRKKGSLMFWSRVESAFYACRGANNNQQRLCVYGVCDFATSDSNRWMPAYDTTWIQ